MMTENIINITGDTMPPERSIADDCAAILQMYTENGDVPSDPEEKRISPFAALGFLSKVDSNTFEKKHPARDLIDPSLILCQEINAIKKCAISAESLEAKKTLEKEWMNEADKLFEFCAIEMRNNLELQNSVHLLYSPDIEKCVKKLLSIYESFQLGHVYFTNAEFDSAIQKIIQVSNEIQISYLLESIEQETLKRK